ncbi:hypothetical protein DL769_007352 [Monosporascus sp. CRB-8-3]|nr:hypothetical protein DL769_007352 [Monosporascus sp. CRB-8-3]
MLLFTPSNLGLLATFLESCTANLLMPLPELATEGALKFQPALDFDNDACYHTAAIGQDGSVNEGLAPRDECREKPQLDHSQTYVRQRCNNGWCAYLYGYYFEKDDAGFWAGLRGHRHDWEHIIVWTLNDEVFFVSWSAHGEYTTEYQSEIRFFEDTHPKIVSHRGGESNLSFRKAKPGDDDIENAFGVWFRAPLVSLEMMACDVKKKLLYNDWGSAHPDQRADRFGKALDDAMPDDARYNEHFDPWH